jgi:hypothetical protein
MRARWLLGLAVVLAAGCGSKRFAPVSGTVTMDGQPLVGATVTFSPVPPEGSTEAGDSSLGKTNEKGEYTLKSVKKSGAQVGKHRVSISLVAQQVGDGDSRPPRGGWPMADKVPKKYNENSELTYDVPAGGTDKANWDLKSR